MRAKAGREEKPHERKIVLKANEEDVARPQNQQFSQIGKILTIRIKESEAQYQDLPARSSEDHALCEGERFKMNADTVTEAVEKALSSSQKGLMQALHQRLNIDEEQRLTLINTIQNLEQKLKHCRFRAWVGELEAQSTSKCAKSHRVEDRSIQGVDLQDELEQEKDEKRLCQAEISSLQRKLLLKENENKKLKATMEEVDAALRNALLEKNVAERHRGLLEIQLRACENELYETANVLKKTQQVLEAERQHYSRRLRSNPLLSLHSFLNSESTISGVRLGLESEYSGQQDVLQDDDKSKGDIYETEGTSITSSLDARNVPLECYDDIMPTRGPKVTADDGAGSKCRKSQHQESSESMHGTCMCSQTHERKTDRDHEQQSSTTALQSFITGNQDEEEKVIGHSGADVKEVSNSVIRRENPVEREFDSETLYIDSDDVGPHTDLTAQEKATRGERGISEDQSRSQWNLDSLSKPRSFSDYKRALVEIGQKLKIEKEAKAITLDEEGSTSKQEVVNGKDFRLQEAFSSVCKQRENGMDVNTNSYSTSQAIPELEFPIRHFADNNAGGSSSSHKGTRTNAAAARVSEKCLLRRPENRTRGSNGQVPTNQGDSFQGREQKACVVAQQGVFKDYRTTLKDIMLSLMQESKHQGSNCGQGAGSCKSDLKLLQKEGPLEDDKAHVSGQEVGSFLKDVQCGLNSVRGVQEDNDPENDFEHNQTQDEGFNNMRASETTNETKQPVINTILHTQGVNDNGRRMWNLEDLEQDDLPITSSIDDEIINLRWRVEKTETNRWDDDSRTRHEAGTFTDEEDGYESSGASQSSTEVQVEFCPSHGIKDFPPIPSGDFQRGGRPMSGKDSQRMKTRQASKNSSKLLETAGEELTRGLTHVQHFYNFIPDPKEEPTFLARSQVMSPITLPKTRAQTAQTGHCGVNNSQHRDHGDQRKSKMEVREQPCQRVVGGAMRELSELLSLHEASLRERFKHGKNTRVGSFENESVRDEKKAKFDADSSTGVSSRRQSAFERRGRSRSRESGRRNFPIKRRSTHSEDTPRDAHMGTSSRRSDVETSTALIGSTDCDDASDCFYKKRFGNKKTNSEEGQCDRTLRTHNTRTPFNVNTPDTGGTWRRLEPDSCSPTNN